MASAGDLRQDLCSRVQRREGDGGHGLEAVLHRLGDGDRHAGLADAAGAGQRHQPDVVAPQQRRHGRDLLLPAHQRRHRGRDTAGAHHVGRHGRRGGVEPLRQQDGQVVADQLPQLLGISEHPVRRPVVTLHPLDERLQPRVAVVDRQQVQQTRSRRRQRVLVLDGRDVRTCQQLAIRAPVQPDEHVALLDVRPIQGLRRVRAGADVWHDRREPQRLDRLAHRIALRAQLGRDGADEHPQPLIRGQDRAALLLGHLTSRSSAPVVCAR
jgi:hypothetical protein